METVEIPTEKEATSEATALILKLLMVPDKFTVLEMARLKEIMANEGYLD